MQGEDSMDGGEVSLINEEDEELRKLIKSVVKEVLFDMLSQVINMD